MNGRQGNVDIYEVCQDSEREVKEEETVALILRDTQESKATTSF